MRALHALEYSRTGRRGGQADHVEHRRCWVFDVELEELGVLERLAGVKEGVEVVALGGSRFVSSSRHPRATAEDHEATPGRLSSPRIILIVVDCPDVGAEQAKISVRHDLE